MGICLLVIARGEELNIQHFFDWKTLSYTYNIVEFPSVNDKLCWDKNLNNSVLFLSVLKNALFVGIEHRINSLSMIFSRILL